MLPAASVNSYRKRVRERESEAMASRSIADTLRLGLDGVKGGIVGVHPLQTLRDAESKNLEEKKRMINDLTYGSAFNMQRDFDRQIFSRFQRPPGAVPSSIIGLEALNGDLDSFGFEDYLNVPQDSESFRPADMNHGMEEYHHLSGIHVKQYELESGLLLT